MTRKLFVLNGSESEHARSARARAVRHRDSRRRPRGSASGSPASSASSCSSPSPTRSTRSSSGCRMPFARRRRSSSTPQGSASARCRCLTRSTCWSHPIVEVHITNIHARDAAAPALAHLVGGPRRHRRGGRRTGTSWRFAPPTDWLRESIRSPRRSDDGNAPPARKSSHMGQRAQPRAIVVGGLDSEHESLGQRGSRHVRGAVEASDDLAGGVESVDACPVDARDRSVGRDAQAAVRRGHRGHGGVGVERRRLDGHERARRRSRGRSDRRRRRGDPTRSRCTARPCARAVPAGIPSACSSAAIVGALTRCPSSSMRSISDRGTPGFERARTTESKTWYAMRPGWLRTADPRTLYDSDSSAKRSPWAFTRIAPR